MIAESAMKPKTAPIWAVGDDERPNGANQS
jgi:hypothetical protein